MITIEGPQIDAIFMAMKEYEKANFGLKFGLEFPQIGQALAGSSKFRDLVMASSMIGMLTTMLLPRTKEDREKLTNDKSAIDTLLQESPLRDVLAEAFFAGFKLGTQLSEVKQLEALAK